MTKVPTARDFLIANKDRFESTSVHIWLIEFAKLHREAILEAVNENGKLDVEDVEYGTIEVQDGYCGHEGYNDDLILVSINKESIDNAYPESLIQ